METGDSHTSATDKHVVDELIEDRAPKLIHTPFWPMIKAIGYPMLGYRKAVSMVDAIAELRGMECLGWVSNYLQLSVSTQGLENVPETGACVIVANHPGGIADGLALWDSIRERRSDVTFFANHDGLKVCPGLEDCVIPVAWREEDRTRERTRVTLKRAIDAFKAEQCIIIFPAGRMAEWSWKNRQLREKPWQPTAISLARKFNAPIVPLAVRQRMPMLYYLLAQFSDELKDMTVFQGLIGKVRSKYKLDYGRASEVASHGANDAEVTEMLREVCERTAWKD
jgi:putative hemolysin